MPATCMNPCAMSLTLCSIVSPFKFFLIWKTGLQPMIFWPFGTSKGVTNVQTCHLSMDSSSFMSPCSHFSLCSDAMPPSQFLGSQSVSLAHISSCTWSRWLVPVRPYRVVLSLDGFAALNECQGSGCDGVMG